MRKWLAMALPLLIAAGAMACKPKGPGAPSWVRAAPSNCKVALSVQAGWVLDHENVKSLVTQYPLADQMLDVFLKRARINPHDEPGRVTFYVLDLAMGDLPKLKQNFGNFLILLDGFKDPAALQAAVLGAFPQEGSLTVEGHEIPLHVVLDVDQLHLRAAVEPGGRIWLGDLSALTRRAVQGPLRRAPALQAGEWINAKATFQGLVQAEPLLASLRGQIPKELGIDLPIGVDSVAWSVTPGPEEKSPYRLELAVTGTAESIVQIAPWLQRIGALASTTGPNAAQPPEIITERTRAGLRAAMTKDQLNGVLSKLGATPLRLLPNKGSGA